MKCEARTYGHVSHTCRPKHIRHGSPEIFQGVDRKSINLRQPPGPNVVRVARPIAIYGLAVLEYHSTVGEDGSSAALLTSGVIR